jgi:hypothetical protein
MTQSSLNSWLDCTCDKDKKETFVYEANRQVQLGLFPSTHPAAKTKDYNCLLLSHTSINRYG